MSDQKLNPNRGSPGKVELTSSIETTYFGNSIKKDKSSSSRGLWKSLKSKANVFNIFERVKSPQPPQAGLAPPPSIPLSTPTAYNDDDDDDKDKLKNEYDRTFRRSGDIDERRKASARITITTATGEFDFAYRPRISIDTSTVTLNSFSGSTTLNGSTTALSTVSQKTDADDALLEFPDLGSDLARYIRDGTPTPSATATPKHDQAPVFGFIPFDERVESYDEDFELSCLSPDVTPQRVRMKSVRFASQETDIEANNAASAAVEVHKKLLAELAEQNGETEPVSIDEGEKKSQPKSLLPRPALPLKTPSSQESTNTMGKPRTPSLAKTLRHLTTNTFIAKRSPSPLKKPYDHKESMKFSGRRNESPSRTHRGLVPPSKINHSHQTLTSPSKTNLGYTSPTKSAVSRASPAKETAGYTGANTTSPAKLTQMSSHTPTSPTKKAPSLACANTPTTATKLARVRPHTPTSPIKFTTSTTPSLIRGKEAHEAVAQKKAAEVAQFKKEKQDLLDQKKAKENNLLKMKQSQIALRRKASSQAMRGPISPAVPKPSNSTAPSAQKAISKLPVLTKKESSMQMCQQGINQMKTANAVAATKASELKRKDSKQSLKEKPGQRELGQKGRTASTKPIARSKLGGQVETI